MKAEARDNDLSFAIQVFHRSRISIEIISTLLAHGASQTGLPNEVNALIINDNASGKKPAKL